MAAAPAKTGPCGTDRLGDPSPDASGARVRPEKPNSFPALPKGSSVVVLPIHLGLTGGETTLLSWLTGPGFPHDLVLQATCMSPWRLVAKDRDDNCRPPADSEAGRLWRDRPDGIDEEEAIVTGSGSGGRNEESKEDSKDESKEEVNEEESEEEEKEDENEDEDEEEGWIQVSPVLTTVVQLVHFLRLPASKRLLLPCLLDPDCLFAGLISSLWSTLGADCYEITAASTEAQLQQAK
ncbi:unnamed protein product [Protopolystoma xenopodis]|uniref:Uncharacterized protein n=1 Tax=Protopolystoma xenopodis TaxID=117903 RepID=A0A448XQ35_9PLAT|nr:unnamed protein product [Protopolystoma xenopodis]